MMERFFLLFQNERQGADAAVLHVDMAVIQKANAFGFQKLDLTVRTAESEGA